MKEATLKLKVDAILENLPPDGQEELDEYLNFLAWKYQIAQQRGIIALGGIWQETPLNVSDDEIRALRSNASKRLVEKIGRWNI